MGTCSLKRIRTGVGTLVCYDGNNLYPVTRVVAATGGASCGSPGERPEGQTTAYSFDFQSGLLNSETDSDNSVTTAFLYDNLGRQTQATQTGGGLTRVTNTAYDDVNLVVTTTQDDVTAHRLVTTTTYDALGRVNLVVDGAGNRAQKAYRFGNGVSYELSSNAYQTTALTDPTVGWTLMTRDSMGRVTTVQSYAGKNAPVAPTIPPSYATNPPFAQTPPPAWGSGTPVASLTGTAAAAYNVSTAGCPGPTTNVTDEASNTHVNCYDGFRRMTAVTEPNGTVTNYAYDLLNNLIGVNVAGQPNSTCSFPGVSAGQTRCFQYSSLSRLISAVNPESGKVSYAYDANGNVKTQTDAQGIVTTIGYDALNRIKSKSYTVPSSSTSAATSAVTYSYDFDASGNFKGTLSSVSNAVSTTSYTHDGFGRVTSSTQSNVPGAFGYAYSLTDQLTKLTYPSGRVVSYVLDSADRVTNVQNGVNGPNYASISYNAPSAVQSMTMGNMVAHQLTWNDRLQPVTIQATSSVAGSLLTLGLFPCLSQATSCTSGNNGNLRSQQITAPILGTVPQNYSYDAVNRLKQVQEGTAWTQAYGYDVNGNRWVSQNDRACRC